MIKPSVAAVIVAFFCLGNAQERTALKFDFGRTPTKFYSSDSGSGFEPDAALTRQKDCVTGTNPFCFSVKLPEGNYKVTVTMAGDSTVTVKAETRRLMLQDVHTPRGDFTTRSFVVNVRTPAITGGGKVHLKAREQDTETLTWDNKLTLEFNGSAPSLRSLEIQPVDVPTLFIAGDSTVCDQPREPWASWGQMLPRFFGPRIAVANYAESGESINSSLVARRFDKIFSLIKSNDWLLLQFGHNDMKDQSSNVLFTYKSNLKRLVARTRSHGATPLLITSMERKYGIETNTLLGYPDAVREVAKEDSVALVDLHAMSKVLYKAVGTNLDLAFQDRTHHNNYGAYELARCVIQGIRQIHLPLETFLVEDAGTFDPARPDSPQTFKLPASPERSAKKPEGD